MIFAVIIISAILSIPLIMYTRYERLQDRLPAFIKVSSALSAANVIFIRVYCMVQRNGITLTGISNREKFFSKDKEASDFY